MIFKSFPTSCVFLTAFSVHQQRPDLKIHLANIFSNETTSQTHLSIFTVYSLQLPQLQVAVASTAMCWKKHRMEWSLYHCVEL